MCIFKTNELLNHAYFYVIIDIWCNSRLCNIVFQRVSLILCGWGAKGLRDSNASEWCNIWQIRGGSNFEAAIGCIAQRWYASRAIHDVTIFSRRRPRNCRGFIIYSFLVHSSYKVDALGARASTKLGALVWQSFVWLILWILIILIMSIISLFINIKCIRI